MEYRERKVSWQEFGAHLDFLYKTLTTERWRKIFRQIDYIPQNGAMVGVALAKRLGWGVSSRTLGHVDAQRYSLLTVDDIADTGETATNWGVDPLRFATIFTKKRSVIQPAFFCEEIADDVWIRWPWEDPNERPNR